jgi:ribosomal protein S18 acetylase RimI-like enzyme
MHPLDNVIWKALNTSQSHLGRRNHQAGKFDREVSPLGGFPEPSEANYKSLASLLEPEERAALFLDTPSQPPAGWNVVIDISLLQMLYEVGGAAVQPTNKAEISQLSEPDVPDMLALTKLTKPGPFARRTREMGDYFGIRQNGELIAMTGERLRLPGYTEVSAVCTHPEHLGHGYATALITHVVQRIHKRGEHAFLHVREDNQRAIELYERLGFRKRAMVQYLALTRND